jgi:ubiquinone/menaquinone biosynthesis C-methylase UbiE
MSWWWITLATVGVVGLVALAYWQLIVAEGTYLGSRVVAWTYDVVANRYDAIKQFEPRNESWYVAGPLLRELAGVEQPVLLDVATGTGRLPLALLRERFRGRIVGLDLSRGMLRQARRKLQPYGEQVSLIRHDACRLPFDDETFDAVTCLEALEFMPRPLEVLAEMRRVLAPGGTLLLTNRVGREAHLLPRRAIPRQAFEQHLAAYPLSVVEIRRWQVNYDLAIARKAGQRLARTEAPDPAALLCCPACAGRLQRRLVGLSCLACERTYPIRNGVVWLAAD